jgi:cholesterol transport system auxiliary component
MIPARLARSLVLAAALPLTLGACITLFPKEAPSPLYRFDATVPAAAPGAVAPFTVRLNTIDFVTAAAGDQILTSNGDQVAYVAGGRWASPAAELFTDAVRHGFDTAAGPARLVTASTAGHADLRLTLHVTRFEAQYLAGMTAAPTVVIHVRAELAREKDLVTIATREFDAAAPASDNRLGGIVPAYDQATSKVVGDLAAWLNGGGG